MLADKYQFSHLFHLCQEKICNQIDSKNVINVIKASYLLGNEKMMAKAIAFLASLGQFTLANFWMSEDWKILSLLFPGCNNIVKKKISEYIRD